MKSFMLFVSSATFASSFRLSLSSCMSGELHLTHCTFGAKRANVSASAVTLDTPLADLLADAARRTSPLLVVDDQGRLAGLIPQVTLLTALSNHPAEEVSR